MTRITEDTQEMVERVARALAKADGKDPDAPAWVRYPSGQTEGVCWRDQYATKARAALEASQLAGVVGERWQPIETAPKDGTRFDAWCHPEGYPFGHRLADVVWEPRYGAFFSDDDGILANDVTHWMQLPEPPSPNQGAKL